MQVLEEEEELLYLFHKPKQVKNISFLTATAFGAAWSFADGADSLDNLAIIFDISKAATFELDAFSITIGLS